MRTFPIKLNPGIDVDTDDPLKREELFGAIVVSVLEQLGYDPASEKAAKLLTEVLAGAMLTSGTRVTMAAAGDVTLTCMLCNEEQAMRATQLAHAMSQLACEVIS